MPTRRGAQEIHDRDLPLHGIPEPAVVGRVRIGAHAGVFDNIIARVNLTMRFKLIVIPDRSTFFAGTPS